MSYVNLSPAYGRDYKSKKEVETDLLAGKDFIIEDLIHPYSGKPCSPLQDMKGQKINIRYKGMRMVHVIDVDKFNKKHSA